jgi:hypothetical protein
MASRQARTAKVAPVDLDHASGQKVPRRSVRPALDLITSFEKEATG